MRQKAEAAEWSTVDSYQSREADVVMVDMVVARSPNQPHAQATRDALVDEDSPNVGSPYMTSYATDPRRLAVALTRARHVQIVFCSEFTILGLPHTNVTENRKKMVGMMDRAQAIDYL